MDNKKHFTEHGWIILKNFFTKDEVEQIRSGITKSIDNKLLDADLLCNPFLQDLTVLNPRILKVVKELLGDEIRYIGDSSISFNDLAMSLHKDNPDRFNGAAPDWQSPYTILRMGIYLEDYELHSGGLILRDRSHNYLSRWKGKIINVRTSPGDLVIWNLRTTHSGNARRYKLFPGIDVNPYINKYLPGFLFKPVHPQRSALFLSYGTDDHHMKRYITYLKSRTYAINRWRAMNLTPDLIYKAKQLGLEVIDVTSEAKQTDVATLNVGHKELPF